MAEKRFNLRVYGILINDANEVLIADERVAGMTFSKFPGGGLEHGEGTHECIQRECMEEMNQPIQVLEHFYTTDFYQVSAFRKTDQLISIYYRIALDGPQQFPIASQPFDFPEGSENAIAFRWVPLAHLTPEMVRWPVDKVVVNLLHKQHANAT